MREPIVIYGYQDEKGQSIIALSPEELIEQDTADGQVIGVYERVREATFRTGPMLLDAAPEVKPKRKPGRPRGSKSKPKAESAAPVATPTPEPSLASEPVL